MYNVFGVANKEHLRPSSMLMAQNKECEHRVG